MALRLDTEVDDAVWDRFVATSPQRSVFCLSAFLSVPGARYARWLIHDEGRPRLGAIFPVDAAGAAVDAPPAYALYQGLLFSGEHAALPPHSRVKEGLDLVEFLLTELERRQRRVAFCLHHQLEDLRGLSWFHYHQPRLGQFRLVALYTGLIDVAGAADFDTYLQAIRSVRRYEYRRGLRASLRVEQSADLELFLDLYHKTFERQNLEIEPSALARVRGIASQALATQRGELLVCRSAQGAPFSATLFLYDDRCGYYLFGANDPAGRDSGSGTYLLLENIRRCFERRLRWVDVCGLNSPARGDFKTSFNAAPVPYFEAVWEGAAAQRPPS